ncbi:hypothetical protein [Bacillus sp. SG-1]|uniref:hypothetical protein n=1 Tax=Bacillus sp. SG-1 TaxID=161544 RepID=UPI0002D41CEE|nr:hypothetical protein [Bacillus sp. SG-1]
MVIQSNMSPAAIVDAWEDTEPVFVKYGVPITEEKLESLVGSERLSEILHELNAVVGSSGATCVEGG